MDKYNPVLAGVQDRYGEIVTHVDWNDVGLGGSIFVLILLCGWWYRLYRKGRGLRMAIKDRNDKEHALLLDIIGDGLLQAEMDQKISRQRHRALCLEIAKKLDLRDLVPKQMMLEIVKQELKKKRFSTDPAIKAIRNHSPTIPGGPPTPIVREKFAEVIGKFAKFAKPKAA